MYGLPTIRVDAIKPSNDYSLEGLNQDTQENVLSQRFIVLLFKNCREISTTVNDSHDTHFRSIIIDGIKHKISVYSMPRTLVTSVVR